MKVMRTTPHLLTCALLASFVAACSRKEEPRPIAADPPITPVADASAPPVVAPVPSSTSAPGPGVARVAGPGGERAWVTSLRRGKGFTTYDIRSDAGADGGDASLLTLHWRMLASRRRPDAPPGENYPALYVQPITLTAGARTIALGDHSGWPESSELTWCRALGFAQPAGEGWSFPDLPYVVASFTVATMQGSSDWLVLDGGADRFYVLTRHTHDGACPKRTKQGPLEVCVDMQWERAFDLVVGNVNAVRESITSIDSVDGGPPTESAFDCKRSYSGERLLPPRP